jgi:hypothetical protein
MLAFAEKTVREIMTTEVVALSVDDSLTSHQFFRSLLDL